MRSTVAGSVSSFNPQLMKACSSICCTSFSTIFLRLAAARKACFPMRFTLGISTEVISLLFINTSSSIAVALAGIFIAPEGISAPSFSVKITSPPLSCSSKGEASTISPISKVLLWLSLTTIVAVPSAIAVICTETLVVPVTTAVAMLLLVTVTV